MSGPDQDEKGQPATVKTTTALSDIIDTTTPYSPENDIDVKLHIDFSRFDTRIVPEKGTDPLIGDFDIVKFAASINPALGQLAADGLINREQLNDPQYRQQQMFNSMARQGGLSAFDTDVSASSELKGVPILGNLEITGGVAIGNRDHITHGVSVKVPTTVVIGAKVDF